MDKEGKWRIKEETKGKDDRHGRRADSGMEDALDMDVQAPRKVQSAIIDLTDD